MAAVVIVVAAGAAVVALSKPTLTRDPSAIAKIGMPIGGGTVQSVIVTRTRDTSPVATTMHPGGVIYPRGQVDTGTQMTVHVAVRRPGWISWLTGGTQQLTLTVTAPSASLRAQYVTVRGREPLRLAFSAPVRIYAYGPSPSHLHRVVLATPSASITVPRTAAAGSAFVSAAPQVWERATATTVSWFPAGAGGATAVAQPAPGTPIRPNTPITLTFSKPVSSVLGTHLPPVSPATQGTWHVVNSHAIQFRPENYGYGLGANVHVALPASVRLIGGQASGGASGGSWSVPAASTVRLQQVLAQLGYLPLNFTAAGSGVANTPPAQEAAAINPPHGSFSWRYPHTPSWFVSSWQPGAYGEITKAAVMAFENSQGMTADGIAGPQVWNAMIKALITGQRNSFGYTVVDVSMGSPETESTWHNGKTVANGLVNTGVASMATAPGTFAVFEHLRVTTMSGTNADGSHYVDPGIPYVSYFNGGDALHGFIRASYGFPQSDGCVEMPYSEAAQVYPYTPIGTIVHVT